LSRAGLLAEFYRIFGTLALIEDPLNEGDFIPPTGYNYGYRTYKGDFDFDNGTVWTAFVPYISVAFEPEQALPGVPPFYQDIIPAEIRVRVDMSEADIAELGEQRELYKAKIIDDVKKCFAYPNVFQCSAMVASIAYVGESQPSFSTEKDDKYGLYVYLKFNVEYRTAR